MRMVPAATAAVVLSIALGAANGHAQDDYPSRPITMVVPFSAGGPTDTVARLLAEPMSRKLGQQIVVENVGGAGGTLGVAQVTEAEPDGYTLLLHHIGMATSATLYRNLPYDPRTAFAPIGLVTEVPMTIVARRDFPADDLAGLIDYVRANPDTVTYANSGIGSAAHLCGMLFMDAIDTQLTTVPYQGSGPALIDLVAGTVDFICDQTTNTTGQIQGGNIKAYAITTAERLQTLPDVPTTAEAGLGDFRISVWHGVYAPAGTPETIVAELSQALQAALAHENVVARFAELGTTPVSADQATPEALEQQLISEIEHWRPIIQAAGIYAD